MEAVRLKVRTRNLLGIFEVTAHDFDLGEFPVVTVLVADFNYSHSSRHDGFAL